MALGGELAPPSLLLLHLLGCVTLRRHKLTESAGTNHSIHPTTHLHYACFIIHVPPPPVFTRTD